MTPSTVAGRPLAVLHDHLDGGVRAGTLVELADEIGHVLPGGDEMELRAWFAANARGGLDAYLAGFDHIMPMLQSAPALRRVAYEAVLDLAADGVVYAELRYAPEELREGGLLLPAIVEAVQDGLDAGMRAARTPSGHPIAVRTILCAIRSGSFAVEIAELAVQSRRREPNIVAFDLAGPEAGQPATIFAGALRVARAGDLRITIHAGEETDPSYIALALDQGAERIGHGISLAAELGTDGVLGKIARRVYDERICLEMAPTSNVHTRAIGSPARHPIARLLHAGFDVTVNTDNRLVSDVSVSGELESVAVTHDLSVPELHQLTRTAVLAGFAEPAELAHIVSAYVDPGWSERRDELVAG